MVRIRVLGGFRVEAPSRASEPTLTRPRASAVLALLAVSGELGCTRHRLAGLLWSERDEKHARHSVRDTLYEIRSALGDAFVCDRGEFLYLDPEALESDVACFRCALHQDRPEEAVDAYGGPLLRGFYVHGAPQFERWVEGERGKLHRQRQRAVKTLAIRSEEAACWDAAADWWAKGLEEDPRNSRLMVRRMLALTRAGDRAKAVEEGEAHCSLLRAELSLEPDATFLELLEGIRHGQGGPAQFLSPSLRPH